MERQLRIFVSIGGTSSSGPLFQFQYRHKTHLKVHIQANTSNLSIYLMHSKLESAVVLALVHDVSVSYKIRDEDHPP